MQRARNIALFWYHHTNVFGNWRTAYQDLVATYRVDTGELMAGSLPRRQQRLVEAWIELYREELLVDWDLADAGEPIQKVPPLKKEEV